MCGISGIIAPNTNRELEKLITDMTDTIIHRGPDGFGYYHDNSFAFGHRRLSVLDLSESGRQPMEYLDRYIITYNGEVYNYLELRNELVERGYTFRSDTDTEVIMAAYDCWHEDCLLRFNGMWSFAIYDKQHKTIFCARDRFGIKPFYYTSFGKTDLFVFASEIKQFTVFREWKATANNNRVFDFIINGHTDHTKETLFRDVYQLMGGDCLTYKIDTCDYVVRQWYNLKNDIVYGHLSLTDSIQEFQNQFTDAVRLCLQSDVKVGSCLSGGMDSSAIVCVANKILKEKQTEINQETVSFCTGVKGTDEQEFIDEVVKYTGVCSHKVFAEVDDLFKDIDEVVWYQDEPFLSTSIYAQRNVFKEARKHGITVMLDGQGADEYLAGYSRFYSVYLYELLRKGRLGKFTREFKALKEKHLISEAALCRTLLGKTLPLRTRKFIQMNASVFGGKNWFKIKKYHKDLEHSKDSSDLGLINYSLGQMLSNPLPRLLHYEDRNSMSQSIESRVPFLDYRLVRFVTGLPSDYKINKARSKYILREGLKDVLPDKIRQRYDKIGFQTSEELWIRENLPLFRKEVENACDVLEVIVDKGAVLKWFDSIVSQSKPFGYLFWPLICLGRWSRVFQVEYVSD